MTDTLIKVENVSKKFCRSLKKSLWYGMRDLGNELLGRPHGIYDELRPGEFWAVMDVSFEVRRGECLGLIGPNGAGKTTLLRMLNGLIKPDKGKITMHGRVGALIALGAGFNPILTGRENVYAAGAVLGLTTREIDKKYDDIVDFSELEEFMDTPVQSYSSGMQVRLGFAVAAQMEPDILILDEVLAVGDVKFQAKCANVIVNYTNKESAVILVSHNEQSILRYCNVGLSINKGSIAGYGKVSDVLNIYRISGLAAQTKNRQHIGYIGKLEVKSVTFSRVSDEHASTISWHDPFNISIHIRALQSIGSIVIELVIDDFHGLLFREVYGPIDINLQEDNSCCLRISFEKIMVSSGLLNIGVAIWNLKQSEILGTCRNNYLKVYNEKVQGGRIMLSTPTITVNRES